MKYLKMLGLAAVAAMALMAFLGASSASATVLCTTQVTTGCHAAGWAYPAGTEIHATLEAGTSALLTDTEGKIVKDTCTESTVKGSIGKTGGGSSTETVSGSISALSFGSGTTPCSNTTDVLSLGSLEIHHITGTDNGTLTAIESEVTIVEAGLSCIYGGSTGIDLGTLTGGSPAKMDVHGVVKRVGGSFLCPSTSIWDAKYVVTSPHAIYVSTS